MLIKIRLNTFWNVYQCLSNETGEMMWIRTFRDDKSDWNDLYWKESFFISTYDDDNTKIAVSFDVKTGKENWRHEISGESKKAYLLDDRLFFWLGDDIVALNPEDGERDKEIFMIDGLLPYYLDKNVILYYEKRYFFGYNRESGKELFKFFRNSKEKPVFMKLCDEKLIVITASRYIDTKTVAVIDVFSGKTDYFSKGIIYYKHNNENIVLLSDVGEKTLSVQILDAKGTGVKWFKQSTTKNPLVPISVSSSEIMLANKDHLYLIDVVTGAKKWTAELPKKPIYLTDGVGLKLNGKSQFLLVSSQHLMLLD